MGETRKEMLTRTLRDSIQASLDAAEAEHRRALFKRRLELARQGLVSYRQKKVGEAVRQFLTYIKILEAWKKVGDGGLSPSQFNIKEDAPELLLISGVYWDLAKIFDRADSAENIKDFKHYLAQFVAFSKGMTFQTLSTESLRKYIRNDKPVHKEDFKQAFARLGGSRCFVVSSLIDHVELETLEKLQKFRDQKLVRNSAGRAFVWMYYRLGPTAAAVLNRCPESFRATVAKQITWISSKV